MRAVTVRLPAGLLLEIHRRAEQKGLDLATAIREVTTLGLETASSPGTPNVNRKELSRWKKLVARALRAGQSPFEPFLVEDSPDLSLLPAVLAKLDYASIYQSVKENRAQQEPLIERTWKQLKAAAPSHVRPLMDALDNLEMQFLARKKLDSREGPEGGIFTVHWLLADIVMQGLDQSPSNNEDVKKVRQLIAARYLVAHSPQSPWDYEWDE